MCGIVYRLNAEEKNFRVFGPDETISNRLDAVFESSAGLERRAPGGGRIPGPGGA
jgi:phosphoketolase